MIFSLLASLVNAFYLLSIPCSLPCNFFNINNWCVFQRQSEYKYVCLQVSYDWQCFFSPFLSRESGSEERHAHPQTTQTEHNELGWPFAPSPCQPTSKPEHRGVLPFDGRKVWHVCTDTKTQTRWQACTHCICLFCYFSPLLEAFAPRLSYLLVLGSCQTSIEGCHEYSVCVFPASRYENIFLLFLWVIWR